MLTQILFLLIGFTLLILGANFLVKGASNIAKTYNIPEILIGLTIVSIGTTLPELVVSIVSATAGNADIVLGNVIGSNLCNLLLILGIVTMLKPIKFEKTSVKKNLPLLIGLNILVLIMGIGIFKTEKYVLGIVEGIILLVMAVIYFAIPIVKAVKENKTNKENIENNEKKNKLSLLKQILIIVLGGVALKFGGDIAVDSSVNIAKLLHISDRVIGLTIVAIGTSLPELITSVVAIIKGNDDIAEGNIIGACTINFCLVLGTGAVISNIAISMSYIKDLIILLLGILLIWLFALKNKENVFNRLNGIIIFIMYVIYTVMLFV